MEIKYKDLITHTYDKMKGRMYVVRNKCDGSYYIVLIPGFSVNNYDDGVIYLCNDDSPSYSGFDDLICEYEIIREVTELTV